jgi:hypothetical protein
MTRRTSFRFALALALATTLGAGCASVVEQPSESVALQSGIVGGQAERGYPAVGALMNGQGLCTGTVFQGQWVVSAAHCFADGGQGFQFYLGDDLNAPSRVIQVAQVFSHPQYDAQNMLNDIAVVRLAEDPGVDGVPLLQAMDAGAVGRSMKFVGYGITGGGLQDSGTKRSVDIAISAVDATTFRYDDPAHNTCNGDSGGPAFVNIGGTEYIAGVTSWGDEPCREFGVDTRVDAFAAFIQQAMAGQVPPGGGPAPNGQDPQGQNPGGQNPGGQNPGGQDPNGQNPGGQDPGLAPQDQDPNAQDPNAQDPNAQDPGAQDPDAADCPDADGDGWCDDPNAGQDPDAGGECPDADFDGWCDDPNGGGECVDADFDGWCDDGSDGGGDNGGGDCADADGDGFCDDGSDEGEWF